MRGIRMPQKGLVRNASSAGGFFRIPSRGAASRPIFIGMARLAFTVMVLGASLACYSCDKVHLPDLKSADEKSSHAPEEKAEPASHGPGAHWDYAKTDAWPELCKTGQVQSPIDISRTIRVPLEELRFDYPRSDFTVVNNGHTIQAQSPSGGGFALGDTRFDLLQFHFHTRSEHLIKGKAQEMEVHFVHKDASGSLAVIGVLIKKGLVNAAFEQVLKNAPDKPGEKPGILLSAADLLPRSVKYYTYTGSLTTPACTEGLKWIVLKDPIDASEDQIMRFRKLYGHNARPVQNAYHRAILEAE